MSQKGNFALVTVSSENYVQWSMVMIHSFLKSNAWFAGDILVFCNDLSPESVSRFNTFQQVRLIQPSEVLLQKLDFLKNKVPQFKNIISQFYSIETFNLNGYEKVLFLDSDMIIVKSLQELFTSEILLAACPESCWYSGKGRNAKDYEAVSFDEASDDFIETPVNSGFLFINEKMINTRNYQGLVNLVDHELWSNKRTFHADQMVMNFWFRNQFIIFDARYNFRPKNTIQIAAKEQINLQDAFIIHFIRKHKPWNFDEMILAAENDMNLLKAYELWYQWYFDFLKHHHLRHKLSLLKTLEA